MKRLQFALAAVAATLAVLAGSSPALAAYPEAPVRMIIPYTTGAGTDVMFRQITPYLEKELGAKIVLENKPGANADIGNEFVARATPDGYTLIVNSTNVLLSPLMQKDPKYTVEKSFAPISKIVTAQLLMVAHANAPFKTVREFIDYARANPNKLNYGGAGVGSPPDLMAELVRMRAPAPFTTVPYKGMGGVMSDLLGGQLDFTFTSSSNIKQFVDSGKLRGIAVSGNQRSSKYPNVPTFKESGIDVTPMTGGFWWGMFAPLGTPEAIVQHVSQALARTLAIPELARKLEEGGYTPAPSTPQAYAAELAQENNIWKQVVPKMLAK
ncbi:MAG: tripartite tricarboxylate transporter substrate binding protein [Burkholderiaceae bacterium]|nr:tripartite tricarboxylate transporter substrate binding protein [Burkholderiaceae bacterium]